MNEQTGLSNYQDGNRIKPPHGYEIGTYRGRDCYIKRVYPEHFFIKYHGFGISLSALEKLIQFRDLILTYQGKTRTEYYLTKPAHFQDWGIDYNNGGMDPQKILQLKDMTLIHHAKTNFKNN